MFDKQKAKALSEKIALLKINGTIDGKKVRKMAPLLKRIKKDSDVKCVVVRVNSPGGTIDASETLLQEFKDLPQVSITPSPIRVDFVFDLDSHMCASVLRLYRKNRRLYFLLATCLRVVDTTLPLPRIKFLLPRVLL